MNVIGLILIPVTILGAVFIYYAISMITYAETDEYLEYEMRQVQRHYQIYRELPPKSKIEDVYWSPTNILPEFSDTSIFSPFANEDIKYRRLIFSIGHSNGTEQISKNGSGTFAIGDSVLTVVMQQMVMSEADIFRGTVYIVLGIWGLFLVAVLFTVNITTERIWQPFFRTLDKVGSYSVRDKVPDFEPTSIDEFNFLNRTLTRMLKKMTGDYHRTKEFNENAAHELQTQLSLIRSSLDVLLNTVPPDSEWMKEVGNAQTAASKLSHIQKSLLLLSKIGNKEFENVSDIDLKDVISQSIADFHEVIQIREINLEIDLAPVHIKMDEGLALVLINNIMKNAVKHNVQQGVIRINLEGKELIVENTGMKFDGDPGQLLQRYTTANSGSMGLGLAIIKQICDSYGFDLTYKINEEQHHIKIIFN